jgi:hypothetical protein
MAEQLCPPEWAITRDCFAASRGSLIDELNKLIRRWVRMSPSTRFGDALEMHDRARGGDDQLSGGEGSFLNFLYGDARVMDGSSRGGDDTLTGSGIN